LSPDPSCSSGVPVALFVYRRHRQLPRTIDCLRAAGIEQLYVFADGAKGAEDAEDVAEVRRLIDAIDWTDPITLARNENVGLSESIRSGLDSMFKTHPATIVIEDDICVAPEFYRYATRALRHYQGAQSVAGVTGLRVPFPRGVLEDYPYDTFLSPRFSSWGWAIWRDRWQELCFDASALLAEISAAERFVPERAGADMPVMIHDAILTGSLTGAWDAICAANMLVRGQYFVTPTWNMIENTGSSDGTHAHGSHYRDLVWEPEHGPRGDAIRFAPVATDELVLRAYRGFFAPRDERWAVLARANHAVVRWRVLRRLQRGGR